MWLLPQGALVCADFLVVAAAAVLVFSPAKCYIKGSFLFKQPFKNVIAAISSRLNISYECMTSQFLNPLPALWFLLGRRKMIKVSSYHSVYSQQSGFVKPHANYSLKTELKTHGLKGMKTLNAKCFGRLLYVMA